MINIMINDEINNLDNNVFFNVENLQNVDFYILKKIFFLQEKKNIDLEIKFFNLSNKLKEMNDVLLKKNLDLENYKIRVKKDLDNAYKYNIDVFIKEYINIIDSLEHGLSSCKEINDGKILIIYKGLELTYKSSLMLLKKFGVSSIDPKNEKFNPLYHEAISIVEDNNFLSSTIIDVIQKGYIIHDRVLRSAKVIVAKNF
ncbi:MAG: nucleotide exchange factor GrpE [Candidatus Azosocius agrarius]|nr:MAG: nucleotide exchange factor GrpE [Gammaproteobacteria bacterium]